MYLKPLTHDTEYEFFVVHDENTSTNETMIYIGLNSKYEKPFIEPEPCEGCWINSTPIDTQFSNIDIQNQYFTISSSGADASQCTDANRPPDAAPRNRETKEELNINSVLRVSKNWAESMKHTHSTTTMYAASFSRMVAMHKKTGALDLSHGRETKYIGSAEMGNFLYGANSRAMGLPEWLIIRGAAGYQAITNHGYTWEGFQEGVINFVTNSGDNPGDPEQTIRGIRYHDEVYIYNQNDSRSSSCEDLESKSESSNPGSPGAGGGGEGGNSGGNTGGSGGIVIGGGGGGGGSKVCFVQEGYPTYCWVE